MEEKIVKDEKTQKDKNKKHKYSKEIFCFLIGILLSVCISIGSVWALQGNLIKQAPVTATAGNVDNEKYLSEAATALVEETIQGSLAQYFSEVNVTYDLTEEDVAEISNYVEESVMNHLPEEKAEEIDVEALKELIYASAEEALLLANEYTDKRIAEISEQVSNNYEGLKAYIDETIVPGIHAVLNLTNEEIVELNKKIADLEATYEDYKTDTDSVFNTLMVDLETLNSNTESNIEEILKNYNTFYQSYSDYVSETEENIREIESQLPDYVTIQAFLEFQNIFDLYCTETDNSLSVIAEQISRLDDVKADKEELKKLSENVETLKNSYDEFTGATGVFQKLTDRVTEVTNLVNTNSAEITDLQEQIVELKNELSVAEGDIASLNTTVATKITADDLLNDVYPVGSVYLSFTDVSPATFLGGTWERITDTTLVGAGNSYAVGSTGGATSATLNASNIPSLTSTGSTSATNVSTSSNGAGNYSLLNGATSAYSGTTSVDGNHSHSLPDFGVYWGYAYGNGGMALQWINASDGALDYTAEAGSHSHSFTVPSLAVSGYVSIGNHSHTLTIPALGATTTYTNNSVKSFSTQDPYTAVYMWKRVA